MYQKQCPYCKCLLDPKLRQEKAFTLRSQGWPWRRIGEALGGVTGARATQLAHRHELRLKYPDGFPKPTPPEPEPGDELTALGRALREAEIPAWEPPQPTETVALPPGWALKMMELFQHWKSPCPGEHEWQRWRENGGETDVCVQCGTSQSAQLATPEA